MSSAFSAGPLNINLMTDDSTQYDVVARFFASYDVPWKDRCASITIRVSNSLDRAKKIEGTFLNLARMDVDSRGPGLYAACTSGCSAIYSSEENRWDIFVAPSEGQATWEVPSDMDDLLMLVLTTGWRAAGWVPIHAGAITRDRTCALVCATSGGGKTTFVSAMVRQGWAALGDDKLLLRSTGDELTVRALSHTFNLDPRIKRWFPEAQGLESYPAVSPFSEKRRVPVCNLWPGKEADEARPTHLIRLGRSPEEKAIRIAPLSESSLLSTLLSQIVIPRRKLDAKLILTTAATTSKHIKGLRLEIGGLVYREPNGLHPLMEKLR
jgi:hypothetical protein